MMRFRVRPRRSGRVRNPWAL